MSKELECLDRIDKRNYLTEREHKEFLSVVEKAIKEYEAIKNVEPTKAMECLDSMYARLPQWDLCRNLDQFNTIKQALLKAQEPKHYLKWGDLEKFKDKDSVKVKMNDTELSLIIQIDCLNDIYVQLYKEKEDGNCVNLLSDFFRNKELFNDLRLELLE